MAGITTKSEWHCQFVNETTDVSTLANTINDYFIRLTYDFAPIVHPGLQLVHEDLFVSVGEPVTSGRYSACIALIIHRHTYP